MIAPQEHFPSQVETAGARIFEFFGPAGVGKSHSLRALLKRRPVRAAWRTVPEALMYRRVPGPKLRAVVTRIEERAPLLRTMLRGTLPEAHKRNALLSMSNQWRPFIECCLSSGSTDPRNPAHRLLALQAVAEALELRALLATSCSPETVVVSDEPLSHQCFKILSEEGYDETRSRTYFQTMPLPAGLVHFSASVDVIVERLQLRAARKGHGLLRHRGLTEQQIRANTQWAVNLSELGAAILRARGVPVLSIDAKRPPETVVPQIERFIESTALNALTTERP